MDKCQSFGTIRRGFKMFGAFKKLFSKTESEEPHPPAPPPPTEHKSAAAPPPAQPPTPAQAHTAAPPSPSVEMLQLPLKPILSHLPGNLSSLLKNKSDGTFSIPMHNALTGLAQGSVKIAFGELRQSAPPGTFLDNASQDQVMMEIPLPEVLARVNPALLKRSPKRVIEVPPEVGNLFGSRGESIPPPKYEPPPKAPLSAAAPTPAPVAPPANLPKAPVPPAPAPRPAPETAAAPIKPTAPLPAPSAPIKPSTPLPAPSAPIKPATPLPAQQSAPLKPATPLPPQPAAPIKPASPLPPSAPRPISTFPGAPKSPAPLPRPPGPPAAPKPSPIVTAPASTTPAPVVAVATSITGDNFLEVPINLLLGAWPETFRQEIEQAGQSAASLALPFDKVDAGLKNGKLVFTWKQISEWLKPALSQASPHGETLLDLPLKIIAPLFLAQHKPARAQKKISVADNIPNLFSGTAPAPAAPALASTPEPAPAPEPAVAMAPAAPVAPKSPPSPLGEVFGQTDKRDWTPTEIVQRTATLKGISGVVLASADGLLIAGQVTGPLKAETAAAFIPQIMSRLTQSSRELQAGDLQVVTLDFGASLWKIFRAGPAVLAVIGRNGEPWPEAQLKIIAAELSKQIK